MSDDLEKQANRTTEWVGQYKNIFWHDSFNIGDACEYREARGGREWVEARVIDYLVEDRPYYVIEYIDYRGKLRDGKVGAGELRRVDREPIEYVGPPLSIAPKLKGLTGPLSQAWDYLVNCGGVCKAHQFDDDFAPAGPAMRRNLARFGVTESTSGDVTIVMLPEPSDKGLDTRGQDGENMAI